MVSLILRVGRSGSSGLLISEVVSEWALFDGVNDESEVVEFSEFNAGAGSSVSDVVSSWGSGGTKKLILKS